MGNKKASSNRKKCYAESANGRGAKRKSKQNQQLFMNEKDYRTRLQEVMYSPEHIFTKIFRKDGPPLGDQFDSLPSNAFLSDSRSCHEENRHTHKRRKVSMHVVLDYETCCENSSLAPTQGIGKGPMISNGPPLKKYGMGKGLMTLKKYGMGKGLMTLKNTLRKNHGTGKGLMTGWQDTYPDATDSSYIPQSSERATQKKKKRVQPRESFLKKLANKQRAKKKTTVRSRKVQCQKNKKQEKPQKEKCKLAVEDNKCIENMNFAMLLDDEELELRELRAGSNPSSCSAHFSTDGCQGCSICKELLSQFPPISVTMKLPLPMQPWASLPELSSILFKAFHFLSTNAVTLGTYSFTLDEFAQAFQDKESVLLGQVNLALLKALLVDIDKELNRGFFSHASKDGKFWGLLRSLEQKGRVLEFWQKSLNIMTWIEILRQVLMEAGFCCRLDTTRNAAHHEEATLMVKYGLSPGTLKGELFSLLLTQGNSGKEVSELAKSSSILELALTDTACGLENLIISALSGDISLFERISSSGYRLRIHSADKKSEDNQSDSEDIESADDISEVTGGYAANDSEDECAINSTNNIATVNDEIDESHPGESWLLGLMEGEYWDLSIEEKLSALSALIDLIHAALSIRIEDLSTSNAQCHLGNNNSGCGTKIKSSTVKQDKPCGLLGRFGGKTFSKVDMRTSEPIDSSIIMSKMNKEEKQNNMKMIGSQMEADDFLHPMQSIFLGSDRRYNRYWLILGPCGEHDPGHRRIYFESSENGNWEIIDTKEALYALLFSLDRRGVREARLVASLEKYKAILSDGMSSAQSDIENRLLPQLNQSELNAFTEDSSSPVSEVDNRLNLGDKQNEVPTSTGAETIEAGKKGEKIAHNSDRSRAFDACIWRSFYSELNSVKKGKKTYLDALRRCDQCQDLYWRDEKHCRVCHTTFELDFDTEERYAVHSATCQSNDGVNKYRRQRVLSSQLQALKAAIYAIESAIPEDALMGHWKKYSHNLWVNRLRRVSTLREFIQVLADFVNAINEDWFYKHIVGGSNCDSDDMVSNFSCLPHTYSAVALWLVKLDLLVASC